MNKVVNFLKNEKGLETVEWAVISALIVAGLIVVIAGLGNNVLARFTTLETATTVAP